MVSLACLRNTGMSLSPPFPIWLRACSKVTS
ncbi:hypothetical protein ACVWYH_007853 [Bradyrhizobium sp. GM24.11]